MTNDSSRDLKWADTLPGFAAAVPAGGDAPNDTCPDTLSAAQVQASRASEQTASE